MRNGTSLESTHEVSHARHNRRAVDSINGDKTIPLATLAEFVTDQNTESVLLIRAKDISALAGVEAGLRLPDKWCPEHEHRTANTRWQSAGKVTGAFFNRHYK